MQLQAETAPILLGEDLDVEEPAIPVRATARPRAWRIMVVTLGLLAATAMLALGTGTSPTSLLGTGTSPAGLARMAARPQLTLLDEEKEDPCNSMPLLRIMRIKSNNLGGMGPDTDQPEGIVYGAESHHAGLNGSEVEIHLNAVSESYFAHSEEEGANISADYQPEWPKVNGITGHFGTVNVHPGTNVTIRLRGYDPVAGQVIALPKWALTFFDLDTGKHGTHSVEFLKINNFKSYFLSNETELEVRKEMDGSTKFTGTVEGNGDDNPENPLELTMLQKNRAVSFVFEDTNEVVFELGSSPGEAARVFQFVVRPVLRCAHTKLPNGTLIAADSDESPIKLVRSGCETARPAMLLLGLGMLLAQHLL
mmetsp:Transcript_25429/g.72886  ORF Transcript_25429/g.72886 Transcript_25429/m.72886 type:complete len:366 (-) Transcript_25429:188-1285(-)